MRGQGQEDCLRLQQQVPHVRHQASQAGHPRLNVGDKERQVTEPRERRPQRARERQGMRRRFLRREARVCRQDVHGVME